MKAVFIAILSFSVMQSCGKKSDHSQKSPAIAEAPPVFAWMVGSWAGIELSKRESFSFSIRMVNPLASTAFSFTCKEACPAGVSVSKDGVVSWHPDSSASLPDYFIINVTAKSANSLPATLTIPFEVSNEIHRLGDTWDKESVLQLPDEPEVGALQDILGTDLTSEDPLGTLEYLGSFGGKYLVLSASHVFDHVTLSDGSNCGADRLFYFPQKHLKFTCKVAVFKSSVSDYAIYEVTPKSDVPATIGLPSFSSRVEAIGQPLSIAGFGDYQNPYRDLQFSESPSCVTFLQTERKVDYSKVNGINLKESVNPMMTMLGAPCEASSGDSGGPVILRDSSVIVGIVSSGVQETFPDAEAIQALTLPEDQRVPYAKLSYVSSLTMFNEINDYVKTPSENSDALKAWLDTQFVK